MHISCIEEPYFAPKLSKTYYKMESYIVIKTANNHVNIVVSADNKNRRLFLSSHSLLYRSLNGHNDIVDVIEKHITTLNKEELLKSLEEKQLQVKEQLCEACFGLYEGYSSEQGWFKFGFDWTKRTAFDGITEENKGFLLSIINTGWHTQRTSKDFFNSLYEKVEGSIISQKQLTRIVKDIFEGICMFDDYDI